MNKLIVTLASWLLLHTAAFALTVSPITIPLMPSQRSANLTIINDQGNEAITIRLLSRTWGQKPGEAETLEATDQLLAYPPQAVIAAGKSQTFRLLLRGNSSAARYFRVLVQTVAKPSTDPNTVSIGQGFSVPVFVEPAGAAGVAALLEYPERWRGARVAVPLCGGNVTQADARRWLLAPRTRSTPTA